MGDKICGGSDATHAPDEGRQALDDGSLFPDRVLRTQETWRALEETRLRRLSPGRFPNRHQVVVKAAPEHRVCLHSLDQLTGEIRCENNGKAPPREDCRNKYCPHEPLMRMRRQARLADALEKRRFAGQ